MVRVSIRPETAKALPGETITVTWTRWPEDFLDALDLLLVYLRVNPKLVRPGAKHRMTNKSTEEVMMYRALPSKAIVGAMRLICPRRANNRPQMFWYIPPKNRLKERLAGAGIDVDTVQVIDQRRWAFAFSQVSVRRPRYSSVKQEELVNSLAETPECGPISFEHTTLTRLGWRRLREEKKKETFREQIPDQFGTVPLPDWMAQHVTQDLNHRREDY